MLCVKRPALRGSIIFSLRRVVEFCDGWFPRPRAGWEPKGAVARLRQAAIAAGRDPETLSITVLQCARRSGRARILPRCRHRTRAAGGARPELRRGAARARQECAADKWSVMADVASFTSR